MKGHDNILRTLFAMFNCELSKPVDDQFDFWGNLRIAGQLFARVNKENVQGQGMLMQDLF